MQKFKLDFSIYSTKDRLKAIENIDLSSLNPTELETVSNYVLYGKDEDGTSIVDRKEVQIKTKYSSYQKNRTVSLDEMMENPAFDENVLQENRTIYKNVKPDIDKEKVKDVPGFQTLWDAIKNLDRVVKENQGKIERSENFKPLSQRQLYMLQHHLIELRKDQYLLMDSVCPTIQLQKNKAQYHGNKVDEQLNYPILPRGLVREENDQWFKEPRIFRDRNENEKFYTPGDIEQLKKEKKPYINFMDTEHLYQLIVFYQELKDLVKDTPDSPILNLLWTLDFYIEKANLSEQQKFIIECKKFRMPNKNIAAALHRALGLNHQENYISTIWNKSLKLIAEAVELNWDEYLDRNYDKAWKVCNKCGRELLRDPRNFVRKTKSSDGLTSRCKKCDREIRSRAKSETIETNNKCAEVEE